MREGDVRRGNVGGLFLVAGTGHEEHVVELRHEAHLAVAEDVEVRDGVDGDTALERAVHVDLGFDESLEKQDEVRRLHHGLLHENVHGHAVRFPKGEEFRVRREGDLRCGRFIEDTADVHRDRRQQYAGDVDPALEEVYVCVLRGQCTVLRCLIEIGHRRMPLLDSGF